MIDAGSTLEELISHGAYDVFVEAGLPLAFRHANGIGYLNDIRLQPQDAKDFVDNLYLLAAGRNEERLIVRGNDEFSFSLEGVARFRVSAFRRQGSFSAVIRVIPFVLPTPEELRIPEEVMSLADLKEGLVLVTGGPGSGKTTTLACLIRRINETREAHIITLEDPIEYVQEHERSIVSQREIITDTDDYLTGFCAAMKQSPDVILTGELEGIEMISLALKAAEGGILVLSAQLSVHATATAERLAGAFPADRREAVMHRLSGALKAVVSEEMIVNEVGNRVPRFTVWRP